MKRNRFTVEAIIRMLREVEVHLSQRSVAQVCRELGDYGADLSSKELEG
jgi:hypothetical protein